MPKALVVVVPGTSMRVSQTSLEVGTTVRFILRYSFLLRRSSVFRSTKDSGQRPEILISHNPAKVFFSEQEGSGDPAQHHVAIAPTADVTGFLSNSGLRTFDYVGGCQAAV